MRLFHFRLAQVVTLYYGQLQQCHVPVSGSAPGIFTATGLGSGAASAINQDSTTNGPLFPARKGSIVALYATGAGQTTPPGEDGTILQSNLPQLNLPVSVQIANQNAQVLYRGPAPGAAAGPNPGEFPDLRESPRERQPSSSRSVVYPANVK